MIEAPKQGRSRWLRPAAGIAALITLSAATGWGVASLASPASGPDTAKVRAAWLLVDNGTYDQVVALAEPLSAEGQTMRASAREALGLAAYKAGDFAKAKQWFEQIVSDAQAPRNVTNRAQIMLDNITASGKAA